MRNRHVVELWGPVGDGSFVVRQKRTFTSQRSAEMWADRMNDRHCGATRTQSTRWTPWVEIHDRVTGASEDLDRPIVPSVGELGYW